MARRRTKDKFSRIGFLGGLALAILTLTAFAEAAKLEVQVPFALREAGPTFSILQPVVAGESLGAFSMRALEQLTAQGKLSYDGTEGGLLSVNGFGSEMDLIDDARMRAFGWCVTLNGVQVPVMPDQQAMPLGPATVRWFYAYAYYDSGNWLAMCVPAERDFP